MGKKKEIIKFDCIFLVKKKKNKMNNKLFNLLNSFKEWTEIDIMSTQLKNTILKQINLDIKNNTFDIKKYQSFKDNYCVLGKVNLQLLDFYSSN